MIEYTYLFKIIATVAVVLAAGVWILNSFFIDPKRDLHPVALNQQSNAAVVRKEHETAVYRNIVVPPGFPLTTGMGLSLGYKVRNGNFGDVWSASMAQSKDNYLEFAGEKHSLPKINGLAKTLLSNLLKTFISGSGESLRVGIVSPVYTLPGFVFSLATLMGTLKGGDCVPHFLSSVPRQNLDIDILVVDTWNDILMLNGSQDWYKLIIVCDSEKPQSVSFSNVVSWSSYIEDAKDDFKFDYEPPKDNSDDNAIMSYNTNPWNQTTSFTHMCLVSSLAAFIKSFPLDTELSEKDHLTFVVDESERSVYSIQIWPKLLAVLLHGGSVSFAERTKLKTWKQFSKNTTLLSVTGRSSLLESLLNESTSQSLFNRLKTAWAMNLFSEGVFTRFGEFSENCNNLRCVYLMNEIKDVEQVSSFPSEVPQLKRGRAQGLLKSTQLNLLRTLLGSRVVSELYSPYTLVGPIASTNYYDYRIFPPQVDATFACFGPISTSLEAKLVDTESNPELSVDKRQGMLCVRGFTIGKPVEKERLEKALELVKKFDGGEGWMPLLGVFGIWGQDGCFYEYK